MKNETFESFGTTTGDNVVAIPVLQLVGFLACIWIMVANGTIILCFIVNRRKPWTNYAKQILSLSVDDFILGLASLIIVCVLTLNMSKYFILCSFAFYFFFSSQCASLYHILGICIYRALTIMKKPNSSGPVSFKISVLLILSAWFTAVSTCTIPFILWAEQHHNVTMCQIEFVFAENYKKALVLIAAGYLLPMIFTNILYGFLFCKLLSTWKRVFPADRTTNLTSTESNIETRFSNRLDLKAQRRVLVTIGVLLFMFDIFTLPIVWGMFGPNPDITKKRYFRVIISLLFTMNSVFNPFVYALRTKCLRKALNDLLRECARWFCERD